MTAIRTAILLAAAALATGADAPPPDHAAAARALDETIALHYAYRDDLPGGELPQSDVLAAARAAVRDERTLLAYAEQRIASLADHHAITGQSFADSWALVPTYADLWVVKAGDAYVIDAVRAGSPAAAAGVTAGERVVAVGDVPIDRAVADFWAELGLAATPARQAHAARVLLAGRRDRARRITLADASGAARTLELPSLYSLSPDPLPPVTTCRIAGHSVVRFNNRLGDPATIAAFDAALRALPADAPLVLDLRDTPSGGNTTVARAILGWFVTAPQGYQVHNRVVEQRETGIARQWVEQVLPRPGLHRAALPLVLVGRWTGSMGEGIAVGFAALGAEVRGTRMAGLKGAVEDLPVGDTDLTIKLPTERLLTTAGLPREDFVPAPIDNPQLAAGRCGA